MTPIFSHESTPLTQAPFSGEIPQAARDAVNKGIALLDVKHPDWKAKLKSGLKDLIMCSMQSCVLGILYGDYDLGMEKLGLHAYDGPSYGFDADSNAKFGFLHLQKLWEDSVA